MTEKPSYQGLSRAYRPQTFQDVCDQSPIITTLKNALRLEKTAQAYLFCGTRGTGKTTIARLLAKSLNCPHFKEKQEPCNNCLSCTEIIQGKNLDVLEIDGASHQEIDDIRVLQETLAYAPSAHRYKIFIIDETHMLTKEAFNALLKVLEEPPSHVKFLLATTEPHKIPLTIISRCQRFDLQRISSSAIQRKLAKILQDQGLTGEEEALYRLAEISDGSLRVAESLLDQTLCFVEGSITVKNIEQALALCPQEDLFSLDQAFHSQDLPFAFRWAKELFSSGKDLAHLFERLLDHYRNILAIHLQVPLDDIPSSLQEGYKRVASLYSEEQAFYILNYLISWQEQAKGAPNKQTLLEAIFLHILKSKHRIFAADLIQRLESLQTREEKPETPTKCTLPVTSKPSPKEQLQTIQETPPVSSALPLTKQPKTTLQDTLLRFASVELEGTLVYENKP